jgi:hypothetical protein
VKLRSAGTAIFCACVIAITTTGNAAALQQQPQQKKPSSTQSAPPPKPAATQSRTPQRPAQPSGGTVQSRPSTGTQRTTSTGIVRTPTGITGRPAGAVGQGRTVRPTAVPVPRHYIAPPNAQFKQIGGLREYSEPTGRLVRTDSRGEVRHIETAPGLDGRRTVLSRGPHGEREVIVGRPGARVVSYGPRRGFVERGIVGRPGYISRTYVVGGRSYARVYHQYGYRGFTYYRYVPGMYYHPRFYGWALAPWGAPIRYAWYTPVTPAPWFGFYAGYFSPYPVYSSPALWLTDYVIAANLRLDYESQQRSDSTPLEPPPAAADESSLTPEVKADIAEEVRQQLEAEKAAAAAPSSAQQPATESNQAPSALSQRYFIASSDVDLNANGSACTLTPGDVLERTGKDVDSQGNVAVQVVSAKSGDCAPHAVSTVDIATLQELQNQFREQVDSGLEMAANNQARGLPQGPPSGGHTVAEGTADPAEDASTQLAAQDSNATKVLADATQGSN